MINETLSIEAPSLEIQYDALVEYEPKPVTLFVPTNGPEQKQAFLRGDIKKARSAAYGATLRTFRGTDELPWFKDLSYYNGSVNMWRHLEGIRGDDLRFMFVLLGKTDPSILEHQRIQYETKTITKDEAAHEQL